MASASNPSEPEPARGAGIAVRAPGGGKAKKLLSMGGTFLTVAVLTGLLWVWADQSQLLIQEIDLSFVLATGADSSLVLLSVDDGSEEGVTDTATGDKRIKAKVSFRGTRSRLRELQSDLQSGELELLSYLSAGPYWAGKHNISVVDLLNANDELRDRGVTVVEAEPASITVDLDEWVPIKKIRLVLKDTPEIHRFDATIEPAEIAVKVPSRLKDNRPEELLVVLDEVPKKITTKMEVSGTVSRELQGLPVRPERSEVMVTLLPKKQSTAKLGLLKLHAFIPVDMIGKYDLKFEKDADRVVYVNVVGPVDELARLRTAPHKKVRAYIDLSSEHTKATQAFYQVTVRFEFDDDVRGVEVSGDDKIVKVRLEKKSTK